MTQQWGSPWVGRTGCWQERSGVTLLAVVFRIWHHLRGLNVERL